MNIIFGITQKSIFDTYFLPILTTLIGAAFGGVITLWVNYHNDMKKMKIQLRVEIWKEISKCLKEIRMSILECYNNITEYESNEITWDELINKIEEMIASINEKFSEVREQFSNNILIIYDLTRCIEMFQDQLECIPKYLEDLKVVGSLDNSKSMKMHVDTLNMAYNQLYWEYETKLLKGLYSEKEITKAEKHKYKI